MKNTIGINSFIFGDKYLDNKYLYMKIRFESKYEDGLYKNNLEVPDVAHHLSPIIKNNKIIRDGLCPKSFNRKLNIQIEFIYFTIY